VTAVSCASSLLIKRKRNSKEKKRNIKSRKIDKRKRKRFSPHTHHNINSIESGTSENTRNFTIVEDNQFTQP